MIELTAEELKQHFSDDIFKRISETADELGLECYVVGGYVRDIFLQRPSKDIDVVVVGSGIEMAEALGKRLGRGAHVALFKNFGTARVETEDGSCHNVEPVIWSNIKYEFDEDKNKVVERELSSFKQFPVKLAWALTIHKSQGLTFNDVVVDIGSEVLQWC